MTDSFYNDKYLKDTIDIIKDNIDDLWNWSVSNHDKYTEEINEISKLIKKLEEK